MRYNVGKTTNHPPVITIFIGTGAVQPRTMAKVRDVGELGWMA